MNAVSEKDPLIRAPTVVPAPSSAPRRRWARINRVHWKLYISHTLSAWGGRMWAFGIAIFLARLFPQSLLVPALYGLSTSGFTLVLAAPLGALVDRSDRWRAAVSSLLTQNLSIALCCVALVVPIFVPSLVSTELQADGFIAIVTLLGTIAYLGTAAEKLIIEKDWIVIIAGEDDDSLVHLNSVCKTIDLTTYFLAPSLVGAILSATSVETTAIILAVWNIFSAVAEFALLRWIYLSLPALAEPKPPQPGSALRSSCSGWSIYFRHSILPAGLSLAFLYMTVLGFDTITQAYAINSGVEPWILGLATGVGSLFGIFGALMFPIMVHSVGIERTGLISLSLHVAFLFLCCLSVFLPDSAFVPSALFHPSTAPTPPDPSTVSPGPSIILFLCGAVLGRFSLWITDLTINTILQKRVEAKIRGTLNGVQLAMQRLLDFIKFGLVTGIPDIPSFGYIILLSYLFVLIATASFAIYAYLRERDPHREDSFSSASHSPRASQGKIRAYGTNDATTSDPARFEGSRLR